MLDHLRVRNLGVLEDASIDPSPGLTVVTGETGAGKTLLLGGLRLILGGAAVSSAVGPYGPAAVVDGLFSDEGEELGVGRTVPAKGRSRAYLEGSIVSAATLGERLGSLVEVVGQHDQLAITRSSHLLELIDGALADEEVVAGYRTAWQLLQDALERQSQLGGDRMELERELDLTRYQADEISAAGLKPGLDDELEAAVSRLRNVEEIGEHLAETSRLAEEIAEKVGEMVARLRKGSGLDPDLANLTSEAEGLGATVSELSRGARGSAEGLEADPTRLAELEDRLTTLGDLKRKYGRTLEEVLSYGSSASARAVELEKLIADAGEIDEIVGTARAELTRRADDLSAARSGVAGAVAKAASTHLADLGLPAARVELELDRVEPGPSGADRATLRFSSDSRMEPGPVGSVASGGELSRLVLAIRLATRSESTATLVFDEVDTGIGGTTALAMGAKLEELARHGQILCVTHLAQVAAHADTHYIVERDGEGVARVRAVTGDDRVTEITRMLAGQPESEAGQTAAAELLALASE